MQIKSTELKHLDNLLSMQKQEQDAREKELQVESKRIDKMKDTLEHDKNAIHVLQSQLHHDVRIQVEKDNQLERENLEMKSAEVC